MTDSILSPERILEAAEEVLRRFGPSKATVTDVARVLGVSHGSVYRHFPSKAALRDAVTALWLDRLLQPLMTVVAEEGSASLRLRRWFDLLIGLKRQRALDDPDLFATYLQLAGETREVVKVHVEHLVAQIEQIITAGIASGEFARVDSAAAARALFDATVRFHDPTHFAEWPDPAINVAFEGVWSLVMKGLGVADVATPENS